MKVIIDTDPGHDDAMALMLALKSPELDVLAVTTVAGNSSVENTTRNTQYILDVLNQNKVPIYSGAAAPLSRELIQAVVHGETGLEGIDPQGESILTNNAVEKIIELVRANPDEITLVTLGPLTNIAAAIQQDPVTMSKVKQTVIMGGAIAVAGNKNRVAEFNIFVDPEAAAIVLSFDSMQKTLVPLDACNDVQLSLQDFERIANPTLRDVLLKMMQPYIRNLAKDTGVTAALMYDPLTVFYLLQPNTCRTKTYNVQVETTSNLTRGMTVADRRAVTDDQMPNVNVVTRINAARFTEQFIDTLSR